jgi:colanic acid/amylovoran biosynthesis glycosyltransferase
MLRWRIIAPVWAALYRRAVDAFSSRAHRWPGPRARRPGAPGGAIAYYVWSFPVLTETFIQREVAHLIEAGARVEVVAHMSTDVERLGDAAAALMRHTHYLAPYARGKLGPSARKFYRRHPLRFIGLFLYVVLCRYDTRKTFGRDCEVFGRAVSLAGVLSGKDVAHIHAPWATNDAFVAQIAARLLQVPYSVEARASDLHRKRNVSSLSAKLLRAEFVITNSRYNEATLRTLLDGRFDGRIKQIYEGVDLAQLPLEPRQRSGGATMQILCVARVIEAKGLEHLLRACWIIKDRGHQLRCDIIGAREAASVNYYIALQRLRRALQLEAEVTLRGAQPFERVVEAYRAADVFVLPSVIAADGTGDVTPNVLMEAMALQLPVVSTRSRAIPEIVEDGVSGILVPPGDEPALADAIIRVTHDEALGIMLGRNARQRIEERFDIRKNIRPFVALFHGSPEGG